MSFLDILFAEPDRTEHVDTSGLTPEQIAASNMINSFLCTDSPEFVLSGYAGTGKTYTIGRALAPHTTSRTVYVNGYAREISNVVYVAPTHKATGVLSDSLADAGCKGDVMTIHSLLACRKVRNNGSMKFLPNREKQLAHLYRIIVVDEASMIGKEMRQWLLSAIQVGDGQTQIIWMGDPAQLPPVNDESVVFEIESPSAKLETIMRNGGCVQQAATDVRLKIADIQTPYAQSSKDPQGEIIRTDRDTFLNAYLERRQTAKMLAWRNDAVEYLNDWVREQIYDDKEPYHIDERLVVVSSWSNHDETVLLHSEDELIVCDLADVRDYDGIQYYALKVNHERYPKLTLEVLHPESVATYEKQLDALKANAIKDRKCWPDFYRLAERFVRVRPGWATTVHKSQGSTYDEVFVVETDLRGCKDHLTRNMLTYVAYSRAKRELWIA